MRGATPIFSADWATPEFFILLSEFIVFGIVFHHVVIVVVHHLAIAPAD